jgi:hypothetical protein
MDRAECPRQKEKKNPFAASSKQDAIAVLNEATDDPY